jgi:hypothetical protein
MKIESNLKDLMSQQSSSLDLITACAEKLKKYFSNTEFSSERISLHHLRLHIGQDDSF